MGSLWGRFANRPYNCWDAGMAAANAISAALSPWLVNIWADAVRPYTKPAGSGVGADGVRPDIGWDAGMAAE